jgi:hypothetical protein
MKLDRKTTLELIILLLLALGGSILIVRARHHFSYPKSNNPSVSTVQNQKINYVGYATDGIRQIDCENPKFLLTELSAKLDDHFPLAEEQKLANANKPADVSIHTTKGIYPLEIDFDSSITAFAQIHWEFKPVSINPDAAKALANSKATISYKVNGKDFISPSFTIEKPTCNT